MAIVDLPGFFLQTKIEGNERILLKLLGTVTLLLEKAPNMREWKWILYIVCKKTIYSIMNAALLLHKRLVNILKSLKMIMNPCDLCILNIIIKDKQLTLMYCVDDLIIAHTDLIVVT